jgi:hypothetical protein
MIFTLKKYLTIMMNPMKDISFKKAPALPRFWQQSARIDEALMTLAIFYGSTTVK